MVNLIDEGCKKIIYREPRNRDHLCTESYVETGAQGVLSVYFAKIWYGPPIRINVRKCLEYLFKIFEIYEVLKKTENMIFHHCNAKLLSVRSAQKAAQYTIK